MNQVESLYTVMIIRAKRGKWEYFLEATVTGLYRGTTGRLKDSSWA